jgi:hypothetical protein
MLTSSALKHVQTGGADKQGHPVQNCINISPGFSSSQMMFSDLIMFSAVGIKYNIYFSLPFLFNTFFTPINI